MLHSFNDIRRFSLAASDGDIGSITDMLYLDDEWRVRYIVADVGGLFWSRKVLIRTSSLAAPDLRTRRVPVALTVEEVRSAPDLDTDPPVGAQREAAAVDALSSPVVMAPDGAYSPMLLEAVMLQERQARASAEDAAETGDPHLRGMDELIGYEIAATDGEIGTVADVLVDAANARVAYLVVDTGKWLPGKQVVVDVEWVERVSWSRGCVAVPFDKAKIEASPEVSALDNLEREELEPLHAYYGHPMV